MSGLPIYNRLEGFVAERVLGELGNGVCTCSCRSALPALGAQLELLGCCCCCCQPVIPQRSLPHRAVLPDAVHTACHAYRQGLRAVD